MKECALGEPVCNAKPLRPALEDEEDSETETESVDDMLMDPEYLPETAENHDDDSEHSEEECDKHEIDSELFVIHASQLQKLFLVCHVPGCGKPLEKGPAFTVCGFALIVHTTCIDGHVYRWESQPKVQKMFYGNLVFPAAIFINGGSYTLFKEICDILKLASLSVRESCNVQAAYIIPEVESMWQRHCESILATLGNTPLSVAGDARCDSPGHNATYGTYTIMDTNSHLILAQETVRVTEVPNSYWLEPVGMERCLAYLQVCFYCIQTVFYNIHLNRDR